MRLAAYWLANSLGIVPATTREVTKFTNCQWWDEPWPDHAMAKQMSPPSAIVRIGFVSAPVLHVGGVRRGYVDVCLKQIEDRFPITAGVLHYGVGATVGDQPSGGRLKLADNRAKLLDLNAEFVFCAASHGAGYHELLANIDASTSLQNRFDHLLLQCGGAVGGDLGILLEISLKFAPPGVGHLANSQYPSSYSYAQYPRLSLI